MDVNHLPLLDHLGRSGRPVLLSTGMATTAEVARAVDTLRTAGTSASSCALRLHLSARSGRGQPAQHGRLPQDVLSAGRLQRSHPGDRRSAGGRSPGSLRRREALHARQGHGGLDHAISADPAELAAICAGSREVWAALGSHERTVTEPELAKRRQFRRRVVLRRAVAVGRVLAADDLDFKRPGTGIGPDETAYVVGRRAARDLPAEHELEWSDLA